MEGPSESKPKELSPDKSLLVKSEYRMIREATDRNLVRRWLLRGLGR